MARVAPVRLAALSLAAILLAWAPPGAGESSDVPLVTADSRLDRGTAHEVSFAEGDAPVRLVTPYAAITTVFGAPIVGAEVRVTNPVDAPLEVLALAGGPPALVAAVWDAASAVLTLSASMDPGATAQDGAAGYTLATGAIRNALERVTYQHTAQRLDVTTRGVTTVVRDLGGRVSVPAVTLVALAQLNDPPLLDLNGPDRPGREFHVTLGEPERMRGVSVLSPEVTVSDQDDLLLVGATALLTGRMDGEAEALEVDVTGSSITADFNATSGLLRLSGSDSMQAYRRALVSLRYVNRGVLEQVPDSVPPSTSLRFTGGVRVAEVEVRDVAGGRSAANATVTVVEEAARRGDPLRDEAVAAPPACSGHGRKDLYNELGMNDINLCICEEGYEGDECEIPPCLGNGNYTAFDPLSGTPSRCNCFEGFSGLNCSSSCSNHGDNVGGVCECYQGWAGALCDVRCPDCNWAHSICALENVTESMAALGIAPGPECVCDWGWLGANCTVPCPCKGGVGGHGTCRLTLNQTGFCECDEGWTGLGCDSECPQCSDLTGSCVARAEVENLHSNLWQAVLRTSPNALDPAAELEQDLASYDQYSNVTHDADCVCDTTSLNPLGGRGYSSHNCSVACAKCEVGTCLDDGSCECKPGYTGSDCSRECMGAGSIVFPVFNSTYNETVFDALPGVPGNDNFLNSGLFNATELYGFEGPGNSSMAYCKCNWETIVFGVETGGATFQTNAIGGSGYSGPFCETPCRRCSENGQCTFNGTDGLCVCDSGAPNEATTADQLAPMGGGTGYTGDTCNIPCKPCYNGTCDASPDTTGECICDPGYSSDACLVECGVPGVTWQGIDIGSRGRLNRTAVPEGEGLGGTTARCECDYMWTGPLCQHPCPYEYDEENGICVVFNDTRPDYGNPWRAEVVCEIGWTGKPEEATLAAPPPALSAGRNCSKPCNSCVFGTCQDTGECLCDYGYIWQGPVSEAAEQGPVAAVMPYPSSGPPGYDPFWHNCSAPHPCNQNGEYLNATCGRFDNGTVLNATQWDGDPVDNAGWGCNGTLVNGTVCVGGSFLLAMAYADYDLVTYQPVRSAGAARSFAAHGQVQGGVCITDFWENGTPLANGFCRCDNVANGRFKHPSSKSRVGSDGGYDYFFQGWAGDRCDVPCSPCSENGQCDLKTGECVCHEGWNGYRCLTPCEPCEHGTCQYDGSCLCDGARRLRDDSYALRLTRDPFYLEKGIHTFEVRGRQRREYVHPAYMSAATVEDYLWEHEYECAHRPDCATRTYDSHLPIRPNQTYFRYTTPNRDAYEALLAEVDVVETAISKLTKAVENIPWSLNNTDVCNIPGYSLGVETKPDACLLKLINKISGRTLASCGSEFDDIKPWDCDDSIKADFVRETKLEIGRLKFRQSRMRSEMEEEQRWLENNLNERQRLADVFVRGFYNATLGVYVPLREPDYYYVWVLHQLLYGVVSGEGAYSGWSCSVPCDQCDPDHGTCQYDGSCECESGWYGRDCSKKCDCFRHRPTKELVLADEVRESQSEILIYAPGTCQRDGSCMCYEDEQNNEWTGKDCFTKCKPCSYGTCQYDGSCSCQAGWMGPDCGTRNFTECLPCDFDHGTCLTDGNCKCDKGYTGLDCSIKCSPCEHGDCQMDGSCLCRFGWSLPDCSKHLGARDIVRSEFNSGDEGWRAYNNSCPGVLDEVRGALPDGGAAQLALRGRCVDEGAPGSAGLSWDGPSGHLLLVDRIPGDSQELGELMYLRAPQKFLGDKLRYYRGMLTWELHVSTFADVSGLPQLSPHAGSALGAPDAVLVGGRPRYNLTQPPWDTMDKFAVFEWSRERFPELRLNVRWTKQRLVDTVRQYLDTPQVVLGIRANRQNHYPPERCGREHCIVNFNLDVTEGAGWYNMETVPQGFGWSQDPFVSAREGTAYVGRASGQPFNPFTQAGAWDGVDPDSHAAARAAAAPDGGVTAWDWERGDSAVVPPRGDPAGEERAPNARWWAWQTDGPNHMGVDREPYRRRWDLLPEVYDAIRLNRESRVGQAASFQDLAWCLASLTELLLKADYYGSTPRPAAPLGSGEAVRVDHVAVMEEDLLTEEEHAEREHVAYMQYVQTYGDTYQSKFLQDYFYDYSEAVRLSICSGNGVYVANGTGMVCECVDGWVGDDCELQCPRCVHGTCVNATGVAVCDCDDGWVGTRCDLECPPCVYANATCVANGDETAASCLCDQGAGGEYCQLGCPPCNYETSTCGSHTWIGRFPGEHAQCRCNNATEWAGLTCDLRCPGPPDYCGNGRCTHELAGETYELVQPADIAADQAFCACNASWVGATCMSPCPGSPYHPVLTGPGSCNGRGECYDNQLGGASCACVSGFLGESCEEVLGLCGDNVVNEGEECDDGNIFALDGCDADCKFEANFVCVPQRLPGVVELPGVPQFYRSDCYCPGEISPSEGCMLEVEEEEEDDDDGTAGTPA